MTTRRRARGRRAARPRAEEQHRAGQPTDPLVELEDGHEQVRDRRRFPAPSLSAILGVAVLVLIAAAAVHLSLRGTAVPVEETGSEPPSGTARTVGAQEGSQAAATGRPAEPSGGQEETGGDEGTDDDSRSQQEDGAENATEEIVVHVSGAVASPGVVRVQQPARVDDAVRAAGGATDEADLAAVNLARPVADGEQVHVPEPGEEPPRAASGAEDPPGGEDLAGTSSETAPDGPSGAEGAIDINTASASELEELPGVGPAIAERIIQHRETNGPFRSADDLLDVSGIGPATLEKMRDRVSVSS